MANDVKITVEAVDKASNVIKDVEKNLGSSLDGLKVSYVALAAAAAAALAVTKAFIDEAAEAEQVENRLKFALEATGYEWKRLKGTVDEFADSIRETTRFSDEDARKALTDMMMYTRDYEKALKGATLAMDMSVRTGQDLGSTSRLIGMAMTGNVEIVGRWIPELRNLEAVLGPNATQAEKAAHSMELLTKKFGGTAANDVNTYAGAMAQLKNEVKELYETIGGFILGPLANLTKQIKDLVKETGELVRHFKVLFGGGTEDEKQKVYLKEIRDKIKLYETFVNENAPGKKPRAGFKLGPEALEDAIMMLQTLKQEEQRLTAALAQKPETKNDIFAPNQAALNAAEKIRKQQIEGEQAYYAQIEQWSREYWEGESNLAKKGEEERLDIRKQQLEGEQAYYAQIEQWSREYWEGESNLAKKGEEERLDIRKQQLEGEQAYYAQIERWSNEYWEAESTLDKKREDNLKRAAEDLQHFWEGVTMQMGGSLMSNVFEMAEDGFKNMGDHLKNMLHDILGMIEKLLMNLALTGAWSGLKGAGGWGGLLGLIFPGGGGAPAPAGGQAGGLGGGGVTNYYDNRTTNLVEATDLQSFEQKFVPAAIRAMGHQKYSDAMKNIVRKNG